MKTIVLTLIACLFTAAGYAQFLGGFFAQKKENRKLLAQQIAALQVYKTYITKGYDIISKGVGIINKIKSGDFDLHRDFFGALKIVNPKIKKYSKVADLMAMNVKAVNQLRQIGKLARSELMGDWENRYLQQVVNNMLQVIADSIDELIVIISDNQLELKDDERIERIDELYLRTEDQYSFTKNLGHQMSLLLLMKEKQKAEIKGSLFLNGVKLP